MKKYVIVNETDDYIICKGICEDYHKAVGVSYCRFLGCIDEWIKDGYTLEEKEEFNLLEADSGYGWFAKLIHYNTDGSKITVNERWYLLIYEEEENEM